MSGRVFQNIVLQFKDAVDTEIGVIDAEGTVIACTELSEIGSHWSELVSSINDAEESVVPLAGKTFKALSGWNGHFDFAVFAYGENEMSRAACSMAAVALNAAKSYYEEKYDKVSFIKNIISDNIMLSDLYIRAKELHVETELNRGVFLIRRLDEHFEGLTVEAVQNIFPDRQTSFALSMGESDVVLIQQLGENVSTRDLEKTAQLIEETLRENGESMVVVGIGTVAAHLRDLAKSYKEAQIAIEVGKVFDTEKYVVSYENLGIGRLIYQLPIPLCKMFIREIFGGKSPDDFDEETIIDLFGKAGAQMLIIDAIIGNGDRHAGNFGWIRNTDTGEYVCMAPLYDFDHALDSTLESDRLLTDAVKFCMPYEDEMVRIAGIAQGSENEVFKKRAQSIMKLLDAGK